MWSLDHGKPKFELWKTHYDKFIDARQPTGKCPSVVVTSTVAPLELVRRTLVFFYCFVFILVILPQINTGFAVVCPPGQTFNVNQIKKKKHLLIE